jgi:oligopeptide/dipeptide ABC transporter ATP-binding protein
VSAVRVGELLLSIRNLEIEIFSGPQMNYPIQGLDLTVDCRRVAAIVGESGSGKSLTALAIVGLLPPGVRRVAGTIDFAGERISESSVSRLQQIRGDEIAILFQNPRASLHPLKKVGNQIAYIAAHHQGLSHASAWTHAVALMTAVGISEARARANDYPHQLSGGMAQRVALAMALACSPQLLIADEPTSGLDTTLREQIIELLATQVRDREMTLLLITHDIALVKDSTDTVTVLYAGRVMESGPTERVLNAPRNPYTRELIRAGTEVHGSRMYAIPGQVPSVLPHWSGCPFNGRCPLATDECRDVLPQLREVAGRQVACHHA